MVTVRTTSHTDDGHDADRDRRRASDPSHASVPDLARRSSRHAAGGRETHDPFTEDEGPCTLYQVWVWPVDTSARSVRCATCHRSTSRAARPVQGFLRSVLHPGDRMQATARVPMACRTVRPPAKSTTCRNVLHDKDLTPVAILSCGGEDSGVQQSAPCGECPR